MVLPVVAVVGYPMLLGRVLAAMVGITSSTMDYISEALRMLSVLRMLFRSPQTQI